MGTIYWRFQLKWGDIIPRGRPKGSATKNKIKTEENTKKLCSIPKDEKSWMHCKNNNGEEFIITSKENDRSKYFLYQIQENNKLKKISKNKNPSEFDDIIFKWGEILKKIIGDITEFGLCFCNADKSMSVNASIPKWIKKIKKLAEMCPDFVKITYENEDGSIMACMPVDILKLNPPAKYKKDYIKKEMTESQKNNIEKMKEAKKLKKNNL